MDGVCGGAGERRGRGTYSNVFFRVHCLLQFFFGGGWGGGGPSPVHDTFWSGRGEGGAGELEGEIYLLPQS